jgi:hypothetical protein
MLFINVVYDVNGSELVKLYWIMMDNIAIISTLLIRRYGSRSILFTDQCV